MLSGKYKPRQPAPEGSRATDEKGGQKMIERWLRDDVLTAVQDLQPIADGLGVTMAQLAIAWVLQNDNVATAIIGASRPEQIAPSVEVAGMKLEADVLQAIDDALSGVVVRDPALTQSPEHRLT